MSIIEVGDIPEDALQDIEQALGVTNCQETVLSSDESMTYDLQGKPCPQSQTGVKIVRYKDGTSRKVLVK